MTAEQRIYEYLIQNGNTNAANAMNMAALGLWAASQNIDMGRGRNKLSTFIKMFPQLFALMDDNKLIYAIPPNFQDDDDYDKTQGEGSLLSTKVPYRWNRDDFQSSSFVPNYPIGYNVAAIRAPRPLPPPPARYNDSMGSPFFVKASQEGGKRKSKCRNAYKSKFRTARKSRSRRNRNRRSKSKSRK
jgi:hypothetical protein